VVLGVLFVTDRLLIGLAVWRTATFASLGEQFSWVERLTLWRLGLDMFVHHPILGVGTGNYVDLLGGIVGTEDSRTTHNAIIGVLSETGLVGLVTYLFFVSRVVAMVRRDLRTHTESPLYPFLLPLGSAIVALLFADWIGWTSFVVWSMLLLGLYVVLARDARLGGAV
jgi:O-antigen ligase